MFSSTFVAGADAVSGSLARLQVYMADITPEVIVDRDTPTTKILGLGDLGDVHVAGSPCVDFSPFGRRRGLHRTKYDPLHVLVSYDQNVPSVLRCL